MKEKLEVRKTQKKAFLKNSFIDEIINIREESATYRIFENENLSISHLKGDIDDDYGYELAYNNKKYPYLHTTKLNTQQNVIAKSSNFKEKDIVKMLKDIEIDISKIHEEFKISFNNVNYRYNLSNTSKLHMNFEDERNIIDIQILGNEFKFNYRTVESDKIKDDIKRCILPLIDNKYVNIEDLNTKNIIIPSDINIYDFFENFLTCENIISNKLLNVDVFSEKLSLYTSLSPYDTKSEKYGLLPFFDWEGSYNPYYRALLIDYGTVVKAYSNKDLSKKYELDNTCCSYALNDEYPSCKLLGAYIQHGEHKLNDMIKSGILIDMADVTVEKEIINFDVKRAYVYESGCLTRIVNPFSFSVSAYRMFGNKFVGVSKDMLFNSDLRRAVVFENLF